MTVVLPTWMRALENKLEQSEQKSVEKDRQLSAAVEQQKVASLRLKQAASQIAALKQKVLLLSTKKLFDRENVFPAGLRNVRTSDPISKLKSLYPAAEELEWWFSVEPKDSIFRAATYYRSDDPRNLVVSHVLYHFDQKHLETIRSQLTDAFGPPSSTIKNYDGSKNLVWRYPDTYQLELSDSTYHVSETCATEIRRRTIGARKVSSTERNECAEEMASTK